jgi:uncharacterized protein (DUF2252 family)
VALKTPATYAGSIEDRRTAGKALRARVPRATHAQWSVARNGRDVVAMLEASNRGRIAHLIPIRYGRMLQSPSAFLRGSAGVMAFDLAPTPASGIEVQACGDAHLMNFGGFATPEGRLVFDLNDFDETLPAPWEWDVKRLAASVVVAARTLAIRSVNEKDLAASTVQAYREAMSGYAELGVLPRWYQRIEAREVPGLRISESVTDAPAHPELDRIFPKYTRALGLERRLRDEPPLIYHPKEGDPTFGHVRQFLARYRGSLVADRRLILDRYQLVDVVMKVVGVGSVGRRCLVGLLMAGDDDALFLQFKEACASVLEPYAGKSRHAHHGQRVVEGQRLMQVASDMFLGWSSIGPLRTHFYVRQLRGPKAKARLEGMNASRFSRYAGYCARALARAHAKAGEAAAISGYLGKNDVFDRAVASFAQRYADQMEADHATLRKAARAGGIPVENA